MRSEGSERPSPRYRLPRTEKSAFSPTVLIERDERGVAYAIETIRVRCWSDELFDPLNADVADVRVVICPASERPVWTPEWLATLSDGSHDIEVVAAAAAHHWPLSPSYRHVVSPVTEFLRLAAVALMAPSPSPSEGARQLAALRESAARGGALERVQQLEGAELERWLQAAVGSPERLADTVLTERVAQRGDSEIANSLTYLEAARVSGSGPRYAELRADREALRMQMYPWRMLEAPEEFNRIRPALDSWRARFEFEYARHFSRVTRDVDELRIRCEHASSHLEGRQTDRPSPLAEILMARLRSALRQLAALPTEPRHGDFNAILLGKEPAAVPEARHVLDRVVEFTVLSSPGVRPRRRR